MSPGPRLALGVVLVLIALGFLALMPTFATAGDAFHPTALYGLGILALLCGLGALACFSTTSHPVAIRIIGATVCAASLWYVASQATNPNQPNPAAVAQNPVKARSQPSFINSILFFVLVGLPSVFVAVTGKYPGWGAHAEAFGPKPTKRRQ